MAAVNSMITKALIFKYIENSDKNSDIFHISAQNIDCSNEYPQ